MRKKKKDSFHLPRGFLPVCAHVHANTITNHLFYSSRDIWHHENETVLIINWFVRHFCSFFLIIKIKGLNVFHCLLHKNLQNFSKLHQIFMRILKLQYNNVCITFNTRFYLQLKIWGFHCLVSLFELLGYVCLHSHWSISFLMYTWFLVNYHHYYNVPNSTWTVRCFLVRLQFLELRFSRIYFLLLTSDYICWKIIW